MRKNIYNFAAKIEDYQKILDSHKAEVSPDDIPLSCSIEINKLKKHTDNFTDEICKKATYYLGEIEIKKNEPQYIEDGCKYFCYWLQVEVLKEETLGSKILKLYQDLLNEYESATSNEELLKYLYIISEHNLQNFRDMVDMYKNFYDFKKNKEESGKDKCFYAQECVNLYEKNIKVCKECSDYDFCYELDNFRDLYNKHMEKNVQCSGLQKILPSYRKYDPVVITSIPCVIILFSPLGSCFLNRVKTKKSISNNIDHETQYLSHLSKGAFKNENR
ncbi:VIR protein [Plasmodium vivax]|uniref:VIR protein n=1 Tax=Plasmodium vivax TaxID=5855 RepID=A0A1G4E6J5_PLAVI|nr:VIR protein [Plasmodium vivax]